MRVQESPARTLKRLAVRVCQLVVGESCPLMLQSETRKKRRSKFMAESQFSHPLR